MKRYIAFLRGINISGKNKIPMPQLAEAFRELKYNDVKTYLNSGNIIFSTEQLPSISLVNENTETAFEANLAFKIKLMIKEKFILDIPVHIIAQEKLQKIVSAAPSWWGTGEEEIYDNLIFVIPPATPEMIAEKVGEPTEGLEQILIYQNIIFWSFDRQKYAKANWWKKTATVGIGEQLTIRTANTLKKVIEM